MRVSISFSKRLVDLRFWDDKRVYELLNQNDFWTPFHSKKLSLADPLNSWSCSICQIAVQIILTEFAVVRSFSISLCLVPVLSDLDFSQSVHFLTLLQNRRSFHCSCFYLIWFRKSKLNARILELSCTSHCIVCRLQLRWMSTVVVETCLPLNFSLLWFILVSLAFPLKNRLSC